ncbi:molecular chaperone [Kosakonia sp. MUSA4]|uniref:fimbrial biogenesis chaperone n=1 Tax=Kosakonia sp. MUSA4 TaxID=2067958 RepID=UPI0035302ABC
MNRLMAFTVFLFSITISVNTAANVIMTGTRIIYPDDIKEKTIQLRNTGSQPFIVSIQVDDGSSIEKAKHPEAPFITTPQIFRMEPESGQSVKLIFTGDNLPQDRESIFYFSFSQLPYLKNKDNVRNQLVLALTNRLKIFYRPHTIPGNSYETVEKLSFQVKPHGIEVTNPTGYYSVIRRAELIANGTKYPLADAVMVPPKSKVEWPLHANKVNTQNASIALVTVNDYGVNVDSRHPL